MKTLTKRRFAIRQAVLATAVLLAFGAGGDKAAADSSAEYMTANVSYNGKSFTVQWAAVDLQDPHLRVEPLIAEGGIGHVESFASMMERSGAVAGVNGTFFDAYEDDDSKRYPNGLMIDSGTFVRTGSNPALAVDSDKSVSVRRLETEVAVTVTHNKSSYTFKPWGVNTVYGDSEGAVVCYTRHFAPQIEFANGIKAVIENGKITAFTEEAAGVPDDGYVCFIGHTDGNDRYLLPNLHVGDEARLSLGVTDKDSGESGPADRWEAAMGVGPKLLSGGEADVDFGRDGFDDPRITSTANARSFVGVDGDGRFVMGAVSTATVEDMAGALAKLGFREAMNMDGGASSGLYVNGGMKRTPGRLLSNALIVKRYDRPQVQVAVDGRLVSGFHGYVSEQGVTMVPFRGIFEKIGASFEWDGDTRTLSAAKGGVKLKLRPDEPAAEVGGKTVALETAPAIVNGYLYIPLRFAAQTLGAEVTWDGGLYRAGLKLK